MPNERVRAEIVTDVSKSVSPLKELARQFTNTEAKANELAQVFSGLFARTDQLEKGMGRQARTIQKLNTNYQNLSIRAKGAQAALSQKASQLRRSERETAKLQTQLSKTRLTLGNFGSELGTSARLLGEYSGRFGALLPVLKNFRVALPVVGVLGLGVALRSTLQAYKDFEVQIQQTSALSGVAGAELQEISRSIIDISTATRFTATQVGQGFNTILRATGDVQGAFVALEAAIDGAIANLLTVNEITPILIGVTRGFGLELDETRRVMDAITFVAKTTNIVARDLGNALAFVTSSANTLNFSIEETAAALGVLADNGFLGRRGGAALRTAFAALASPTAKLQRTFDDLGITLENSVGEFVGLIPAIDALVEGGFRAGDSFNFMEQRAASVLAVLIRERRALIETTRATEDARGETERIARTMEQTLETSIYRVNSAWKAFLVTLNNSTDAAETAEKSLGIVERALIKGREALEWYQDNRTSIREIFRLLSFTPASPQLVARSVAETGNAAAEAEKKVQSAIHTVNRWLNLDLADFQVSTGIDISESARGEAELLIQRRNSVAEGEKYLDIVGAQRRNILNNAAIQRAFNEAQLNYLREQEAQLTGNLAILEREQAIRGDATDALTLQLSKRAQDFRDEINSFRDRIRNLQIVIERERLITEAKLNSLDVGKEELRLIESQIAGRIRLREYLKEQNELSQEVLEAWQNANVRDLAANQVEATIVTVNEDNAGERQAAKVLELYQRRLFFAEQIKNINDEYISGLLQGLSQATLQVDNLGQAFQRAAQYAAALTIEFAIGRLFSAAGIQLPARQFGGPVQAGLPYEVGERGRELFVPNSAGRIIPNGQYGNQTTNNYFTLQGTGNFAEDVLTIAEAVRNNS